MLRPMGRFYMVQAQAAGGDSGYLHHQAGAETDEIRPPYADREANMVLIEAVRGGGAPMKVESLVVLMSGQYSDEIRTTYGY